MKSWKFLVFVSQILYFVGPLYKTAELIRRYECLMRVGKAAVFCMNMFINWQYMLRSVGLLNV